MQKVDKLTQALAICREENNQTLANSRNSSVGNSQPTRTSLEQALRDISRPRFALVIGNGAYHDSPLNNPENDAEDISMCLRQKCNFQQVFTLVNKTHSEMTFEIKKFKRLVNSREMLLSGRVIFFYFSGHGGTERGELNICPIVRKSLASLVWNTVGQVMGVDLQMMNFGREVVAELDATSASCERDSGLNNHELSKRNCNFFVVDACRAAADGVGDGQYSVKVPKVPASFYAFSCAPGEMSYDGPVGKNGRYTACLLGAFTTNSRSGFSQLFKTAQIAATTNGTGLSPTLLDCTGQDFTFQYDATFKRKVEKIRTEILSKESGNIWENFVGRTSSALMELWSWACQT